jgi:hypothetical protein
MTVTVEAKGNDILDALELTVASLQETPGQDALKVFQNLVKEVEYTYEEVAA